jgi:hypothetical protein
MSTTKHANHILQHVILGVVWLAISYGFASWAIDSGELWHYGVGFIALVLAIRSFVSIFKSNHAKKPHQQH